MALTNTTHKKITIDELAEKLFCLDCEAKGSFGKYLKCSPKTIDCSSFTDGILSNDHFNDHFNDGKGQISIYCCIYCSVELSDPMETASAKEKKDDENPFDF